MLTHLFARNLRLSVPLESRRCAGVEVKLPFILVRTKASNNLIFGGTVFPGVSVPGELIRVYAGFVKSLNDSTALGPRKCAAQMRKRIWNQPVDGNDIGFQSPNIVLIQSFGGEREF